MILGATPFTCLSATSITPVHWILIKFGPRLGLILSGTKSISGTELGLPSTCWIDVISRKEINKLHTVNFS